MDEKVKNEFEMRDELLAKRKEIETMDDLVDFLKYVETNCNYDYGVAPRSIAQAVSATARYMAKKMGITAFQAGFVMWDFIQDWMYSHNKCGMKMVDYDDMLYPQHADKFEKTIRPYVWEALQEQAKKNLETSRHAHPSVIAHWQSIVDGVIPFGYVVKED